jgi:hypothetical protein
MRFNKISLASMLLGGSMLLAACGGSGGGGGIGGGSDLTVRGTAAIGKALVGPLSVTCKTGTGTGTSNSDGSFTVVINNGVGPCLLTMTVNGATLYSISSGSTATQTANLTPMTTLLVNYLRNVPGMTAASPEAWFALPQVKTLLADTAALTKRIVEDFIPALKALVPAGTTLSLTDAGFLFTTFTPNPSTSSTDADLEKLRILNFVTDIGKLVQAFVDQIIKEALKDTPVVLPTGATGAAS